MSARTDVPNTHRSVMVVAWSVVVIFAILAYRSKPAHASEPPLARATGERTSSPPRVSPSRDPDPFVSHIAQLKEFVQTYCLDCHSFDEHVANLDIESLSLPRSGPLSPQDRIRWELVYKRVASRQMPPVDADRPDAKSYSIEIENIGRLLDAYAEKDQAIAPVPSLRRMTRTEYQNSIRDLLRVNIDAKKWLPRDESSQGFDNITTGELSPTLISRYLSAAQRISRLAVGRPTGIPIGVNVRLPPDLTQARHLEGLPFGTRGGVSIRHTFAETGVYELSIRLARDRDEKVEGLNRKSEVDVLIDRQKRKRFVVRPPKSKDYSLVDSHLKFRFTIEAGPHDVAVTFPSRGEPLLEIRRQPFDAAYNRHRHPRQQPAIYEVAIVGPLNATPGDIAQENDLVEPSQSRTLHESPSRRQILTARPASDSIEDQLAAANEILTPIVRRAFRRDVTDADLAAPLRFFRDAITTTTNEASHATIENTGDANEVPLRFETGIEMAIASILVNPHFLFRAESASDTAGSTPVAIDDFELASRLSYFLWSSLPDDELLDLASENRLGDPRVLSQQVDRLLADARSESLVTNFASQWLHLRNLGGLTPDLRKFPDFDENLRRSMRWETQHLFADVMGRDASVMELIDSPFTFLNHRLAKHYGIVGVSGSHFRRVDLRENPSPAKRRRGGILRHASILSVTSYATRTSPTIRGNWVLENLLGTPPPPPPPNVPALKDKTSEAAKTVRERLAQHRANPSCASCHDLIDPVGFALDQFDAVGRWRTYDGEEMIDSSGTLPDGTEVTGVEDLEQSLLDHPERFVTTMVEKLMTFGLGRGVDYRDAATIRKIVREAKPEQFRFSALIHGIVQSKAFRFRSNQDVRTE